MKKSKIKNRQPKPKLINEQNADKNSVSPAIAKPNVIGSQSPPMSLDDAISELSVKGKIVSLNDWVNFIMSCLKNVKGFYEWFDEKYKRKEFSIVAKVGDGFYIDLTQIRELYSLMSSNAKLVNPPS